MEDQIISQEGYNKLKDELELLTTVKRREVAERIERAKELGDLSENAEYQEAKEDQAFNEGRILEIQAMLKNVTIVDESSMQKGRVSMGSKIVVLNKDTKKEREFTIVSFNEADPAEGNISNESPIGTAFLGKKKGDEAKVGTPKGEVNYKILKVS